MSVLIKGIHIPTGCAFCFYNRDTRCLLLPGSGYDETNGENRRPNCPIIELPDHGDLIDKTDLMASLADWQLSEAPEEGINWDSGRDVTSHELQYSIYRLLGDVYEEVRDEPVIIPAERSVKVCPLHSDDEVTEYCVEGPCTDEMEGRCPMAERSEDA